MDEQVLAKVLAGVLEEKGMATSRDIERIDKRLETHGGRFADVGHRLADMERRLDSVSSPRTRPRTASSASTASERDELRQPSAALHSRPRLRRLRMWRRAEATYGRGQSRRGADQEPLRPGVGQAHRGDEGCRPQAQL